MATTLETAAAQYAEARTSLNEALDGEQEAQHRAWAARNAVESCRDALNRAEEALLAAAAPDQG